MVAVRRQIHDLSLFLSHFFSRRTGPNGKPEINENERNLLITSKNNKQQ